MKSVSTILSIIAVVIGSFIVVKIISYAWYSSIKTLLTGKTNRKMASGGQIYVEKDNMASRQLYVVRHGERMDYVFGDDWIDSCFDSNGSYTAQNSNMPKIVPDRAGGPKSFGSDAPITVNGYLRAVKVGDNLKTKGVTISHVYSSPALRCIDTATGIIKGLGSSLNIIVEPGLFELISLYSKKPRFLTQEELVSAGFDINVAHNPIWPYNKYNEDETREEMYIRNGNTSQEIMKRHEGEGGNILIVGHAATLDTTTRTLLRKPPVTEHEFHYILCAGYCSLKSIQEYVDSKTKVRTWESTKFIN